MGTNPEEPEAPSGLPDEGDLEPPPLGTPDPDDEAADTGEEAMPGIASVGEPPTSG
jgi:hypothetical protein